MVCKIREFYLWKTWCLSLVIVAVLASELLILQFFSSYFSFMCLAYAGHSHLMLAIRLFCISSLTFTSFTPNLTGQSFYVYSQIVAAIRILWWHSLSLKFSDFLIKFWGRSLENFVSSSDLLPHELHCIFFFYSPMDNFMNFSELSFHFPLHFQRVFKWYIVYIFWPRLKVLTLSGKCELRFMLEIGEYSFLPFPKRHANYYNYPVILVSLFHTGDYVFFRFS